MGSSWLVFPEASNPSQDRFFKAIAKALEGTDGVRFGDRWRMVSMRYPDDTGPLCLVCLAWLKGQGWRPAAVISPDGIVAGTGSTGGSTTPIAPEYTTAGTPTADAAHLGWIIRVSDPGVDDVIKVCRKLSGGTYEWFPLGY